MKPLVLILLLVICLLPLQAHADSISCDGGIVSIGDTSVVLMMKCGQPVWKDSRTEEIVDRIDKDTRLKTFIIVEEWTYDFGPDRLMRMITLRDGTIVDIRTGGYGY